jgi:transcriptional regulator GlxA family with amidase domain
MEHFTESITKTDPLRITVLVFDHVVLQDLAGPLEVFSKAHNLTQGQYSTFTVAPTMEQVLTENSGLTLTPDYSFATMPEADYLIIPGASMPVINTLRADADFSAFLSRWLSKAAVKTVSICTAAYLLADIGVMNNKKATTYFFVADDFASHFPLIELVRDVRFVEQQNIISSSGVTSGIDAALYSVGQHSGAPLRNMIARALRYDYQQQHDWPIAEHGMTYHGE